MISKFNIAVIIAITITTIPICFAQDPAKARAGERTYRNYCATCHGDDLVNTSNGTFDLRKLREDERPRFENSVTNGKNQMPPWRGVISPEQMDEIWNYIRTNANDRAK